MKADKILAAISFCPLLVVILFVGLNYFISIPENSQLRQIIQYEPDLYGNFTPVYITGLLINIGNLSRISDMIKYWGNDFKMLSPNSKFTIGTTGHVQNLPDATIATQPRQVGGVQQYHYVFEDHLQYFLNHTNLRWFIRTTEDSFTHLKRLPQFIADLEAKYNPLKDVVMEGQSVELSATMFIHGGAGWVMSRAAAKYYFDNRDAIHDGWLGCGHGDDVMPFYFMSKLGWDVERMRNDAFIGSPVIPYAREWMIRNDYSKIIECPSVAHQKAMKRPIMPLNKTVFWHSSAQVLWTLTDGYRILEEAGNLAMGHVDGGVIPCRPTGLQEFAQVDTQWV